jgi:excinuclease ABC subunit A
MQEADYIIDMGPLASHLGGEITAQGTYKQICKNPQSLTGQYLNKTLQVTVNRPLITPQKFIEIHNATQNNLKNISVNIPLNCLCVVSGVSGSGKTTLIKQIAYPAIAKLKDPSSTEKIGAHDSLEGALQSFKYIEMIDQNPIGKSSRSNPVTYIKAYESIREIMATQQLSKIRGFTAKHFSFNTEGGRCETCTGDGSVTIQMQFLADVHLQCESCKGQRFKEEVLEVNLRNKNIYDILEMSVDQALEFFTPEKEIHTRLKPLQDVGLGYIKLGQSSDTLSGGEAQRIKLASYLGKGNSPDPVLFIFDEPTTGLHFHDIQKLLTSFQALIQKGHSIWVIEHNIDVIKHADWLIELGPEGGATGGYLQYQGPPKGITHCAQSHTKNYM